MISHIFRICLLLVFAVPVSAQSQLPPLPPLTSPATNVHLPGKFVWADLFSSDLDASRHFYQELFGWDFRWISEQPEPYGIFSMDGQDVAGIAFREVADTNVYARWVHYVSVRDVDRAQTALADRVNGRTLLRSNVADRGEFAIFSTPGSALLGVIHSSSGDPEDMQSLVGEWIWRQLYVHDIEATVALLRDLTDYDIESAADNEEVDRLLISEGYLRAGLAKLPADSDAGPAWLGFIRVNDVPATLARATALGAKVQHSADSQDMAIIADPQGGLIGLLKWDYPDEGTDSEGDSQ